MKKIPLKQKPERILDKDRLLRRIQFLDPNFFKPDGTPASSSFTTKPRENGLSVDIERMTTYEKSIQDINRFRLFALQCEYIRHLGFECIHDPLVGNHAHALIAGQITRTKARKFASHALRIEYP
nr:hypothetical protein [Bacteroidota bacterium]